MIRNPVIRVLMLVTGVAFAAFGVRDAGDGVEVLALGLGLGAMVLPFVAAAPLRPGELDARSGARELGGEQRRGTLLVPPRRFVLALGVSALGLATTIGAMAGLVARSGDAPAAVAVVLAVVAVLVALLGVTILRRIGRIEDLSLVLTPEGLGPLGATAQWVPWEDVTAVRFSGSAERNLLSPTVEVRTTAERSYRLGASATPMDHAALTTLLDRLRADATARSGLATADRDRLLALARPEGA